MPAIAFDWIAGVLAFAVLKPLRFDGCLLYLIRNRIRCLLHTKCKNDTGVV
jgi:hypothetical protein